MPDQSSNLPFNSPLNAVSPATATPATTLPGEYIVQMENITKRFPGVVANQNVHLRVVPGTLLTSVPPLT